MNIQNLRRRVAQRAMRILFGARHLTQANTDLLPAQGIFRILICRITHSLGNTLLLTPLIREIETVYPGAEIDVVTRSGAADDIFGTFFSIRNIYCLPARAFAHPLWFLDILRRVHRTRYDLVIDPCQRSQTGRLMLLFAKGRFKLGFASDIKKGALTHTVPAPSAPKHSGQSPVYLLRTALGLGTRRAYPVLDLALTLAERKQGRVALARLTASAEAHAKKGVIGIFANATGPKVLDGTWWRGFMRALEANQLDHSIIEIVPMFGRSLLDARYPGYYSSDIRKLASVLSGLSLFISADCGIMHLACASGVPVVGIFTVTDAEEWGPSGPRDRAIHAKGLTPEQVAERVAEAATGVSRIAQPDRTVQRSR